EVPDGRLQPRGDGVAAAERVLAEEEMEDGFVADFAGAPVAVRHRQLIEVGQKGDRSHVTRRDISAGRGWSPGTGSPGCASWRSHGPRPSPSATTPARRWRGRFWPSALLRSRARADR